MFLYLVTESFPLLQNPQKLTKKLRKKMESEQRKREQEMAEIGAELQRKQEREKEKQREKKRKAEQKDTEEKENEGNIGMLDNEKPRQKTCLWVFRPGSTQTWLYSHRLETSSHLWLYCLL